MMWGYGSGGWWMMLMPLLWIALVAVVVWAVVRVLQTGSGGGRPDARRETPLEILDRRYALGEIDDTTYAATRARLTGREPSPR